MKNIGMLNKKINVVFILIVAAIVLPACSTKKSSQENEKESTITVFKQYELTEDKKAENLDDIMEYDITEIRIPTPNKADGIISRTVDKEIIDNIKELASKIEKNDEKYELEKNLDGDYPFEIWFISGQDIIYYLIESYDEIEINEEYYGMDKGTVDDIKRYCNINIDKFEVIE